MRWATLALAALVLTGCETSAEKSAKIEKVELAKLNSAPAAQAGLKITTVSRILKVTSTAVVQSPEGIATVVTLRNDSATAQRAVPLEITVRASDGSTLYSNTGTGLGASLTSVSYIPAHGTTTWVDDQVQGAGTPTSVTAIAGEGKPAPGRPPNLTVHRESVEQEGGGTEVRGTATNGSPTAQRELVIYAVSRHGGKTVAAGRAVLRELPAGASAPFSILLIGPAAGSQGLELSAPPTALG